MTKANRRRHKRRAEAEARAAARAGQPGPAEVAAPAAAPAQAQPAPPQPAAGTAPAQAKRPIRIFVSSTVYRQQETLDQIDASLTGLGYHVSMSHKGSVIANPRAHPFASCLKSVGACDVFLGIISQQYGSGRAPGENSITHQELEAAMQLDKPRWMLAHQDVITARTLLGDLGYKTSADRQKLKLDRHCPVINDLRLIDMYELATLDHVPFKERRGSWVQQYSKTADIYRFINEQFGNPEEVAALIAAPPPAGEGKS